MKLTGWAMMAALVLPASAMGMTLDGLRPGKTAHGEDLGVADMKGKVVFVEIWGVQ